MIADPGQCVADILKFRGLIIAALRIQPRYRSPVIPLQSDSVFQCALSYSDQGSSIQLNPLVTPDLTITLGLPKKAHHESVWVTWSNQLYFADER